MMDKIQKHNSFNTNTPSSESYRNWTIIIMVAVSRQILFMSRHYTLATK